MIYFDRVEVVNILNATYGGCDDVIGYHMMLYNNSDVTCDYGILSTTPPSRVHEQSRI